MSHPLVSIVIPCKGRLDHLKDSLPYVLQQEYRHTEILVIDYRCPQGCSDWVIDEVKDARVRPVGVLDLGDDDWNLSAARNVGIRVSQGQVLWFLDADARPDPTWLLDYLPSVTDTSFVAAPSASIMATKSATLAAGGFNEALTHGWGWEDIDFIRRMNAMAKTLCRANSVSPLTHGDDLRNTFHRGQAINRTLFENQKVTEFRGL